MLAVIEVASKNDLVTLIGLAVEKNIAYWCSWSQDPSDSIRQGIATALSQNKMRKVEVELRVNGTLNLAVLLPVEQKAIDRWCNDPGNVNSLDGLGLPYHVFQAFLTGSRMRFIGNSKAIKPYLEACLDKAEILTYLDYKLDPLLSRNKQCREYVEAIEADGMEWRKQNQEQIYNMSQNAIGTTVKFNNDALQPAEDTQPSEPANAKKSKGRPKKTTQELSKDLAENKPVNGNDVVEAIVNDPNVDKEALVSYLKDEQRKTKLSEVQEKRQALKDFDKATNTKQPSEPANAKKSKGRPKKTQAQETITITEATPELSKKDKLLKAIQDRKTQATKPEPVKIGYADLGSPKYLNGKAVKQGDSVKNDGSLFKTLVDKCNTYLPKDGTIFNITLSLETNGYNHEQLINTLRLDADEIEEILLADGFNSTDVEAYVRKYASEILF